MKENIKNFELAKYLNLEHHSKLKRLKAHFRAGLGGVSLISLHPETPELGETNVTPSNAESKINLLLKKKEPGRPTPEKSLQAWLIQKVIFDSPPDFWRTLSLRFLTSELRIANNGTTIVNDILACDSHGGLWVIELKSKRDLTTLIAQCNSFSQAILNDKEFFSSLITVHSDNVDSHCWDGETIRKMIIWPESPSGKPSITTKEKIRNNAIHEVEYGHTGNGSYYFKSNFT